MHIKVDISGSETIKGILPNFQEDLRSKVNEAINSSLKAQSESRLRSFFRKKY